MFLLFVGLTSSRDLPDFWIVGFLGFSAFGGADLFKTSSGYKQGPGTAGICTERAQKHKGSTHRGPDTQGIYTNKPPNIIRLHKQGPKQKKHTNKAQAQNNLAKERPDNFWICGFWWGWPLHKIIRIQTRPRHGRNLHRDGSETEGIHAERPGHKKHLQNTPEHSTFTQTRPQTK